MAQKSEQKFQWADAPDRVKRIAGSGSHIRTLLPNGLVIPRTGGLYITRKVPLQPVENAKTIMDKMEALQPLFDVLDELSALVPIGGIKSRNMMRKNYRRYELLGVNIPKAFSPQGVSLDHKTLLKEGLPGVRTDRRMLLMSVKLKDTFGGDRGWRKAVESVVESMLYAEIPLADFDPDLERVESIFAGAGFQVPTAEEIKFADAFFNHGSHANVVRLPHSKHMHIFDGEDSALMAERAGKEDCKNWPDIPGHHALTVSSVNGFDFDFINPEDSGAQWVTELFRDDAIAVSIKGAIEPAEVTRAELRRRRSQYIADIEERVASGKMNKADQESHLQLLEDVEHAYSDTKNASATSVDTSILVAFDGVVEQLKANKSAVTDLRTVDDLQAEALEEMLPYSPLVVNPLLQDLPVQTIAGSGIQGLCQVGDSSGALVGITESDNQAVYETHEVKIYKNKEPLIANIGNTGSGKSTFMVAKSLQFNMAYNRAGKRLPQVVIDPKMNSDFSEVYEYFGGQVVSLDTLLSNDGIFDPLRFAQTDEAGIALAVSTLISINPWGSENPVQYEAPLREALMYGVRAGEKCTGAALEIASHHGRIHQAIVGPIFEYRSTSVMFQAIVGLSPHGEALRFHDGLTYIRTGNQYLDLPDPSQKDLMKTATIEQKVAMALVRMMVFGSLMALAGREGKVHLDEAWVFLIAGQQELQIVARTARSMEVTFDMYSQTLADVVKAGLKQYITRGYILSTGEDEAKVAFDLFGIEDKDGLLSRVTAKAEKPVNVVSAEEDYDKPPNYESFKPLFLERRRKGVVHRKFVRGPLAIVVDLSGKMAITEIKIPPAMANMIVGS
ncbi:ATP-binding protein [Glutamicibacter ardleyensis]|uniref:ATP-binding protein n=1 Tax=Glutamicibacter ardleyensis TaxID=225894 RepID=UPI003FD1C72B